MADSSPQGGVNWLMIEYLRSEHADLIACAATAVQLTRTASRSTEAEHAGIPKLQKESFPNPY